MNLTRLCFVGMFVALGMATTALAEWGTYAYAKAHSEAFNTTPETNTEVDDLWEPHSEADAYSGSLSVVHAHVSTGDLGVYVDAAAVGSSSSTAEGIAEWKDTFVFSVANQPDGTQFDVDAAMTAHGTFHATATEVRPPGQIGPPLVSSSADVGAVGSFFGFNADPGFGNIDFAHGGRRINTYTGEDITDPFPTNSTVQWVLTNGEIYTFLFELHLTAYASAGGDPADPATSTDSEGSGDFSGSLHWGGIQSVRDAVTGELITDWTITSESGFDYSKPFPVPEPPAVALLLALVCLHFVQPRTLRHPRG